MTLKRTTTHEVILPDEYKTDKSGHTTVSRKKSHMKEKKERVTKPWTGKFQAFDGEGWDGKYIILACSAMPYDLCDEEGLSTGHCLSYLTNRKISSIDAIIGYGLSYDFEMILKDLPEDDFFRLKKMEQVEFYDGEEHFSLLNYIPRKQLEIHRHYTKYYKDKKTGEWIKEEANKKIILQDVIGFFQSSFEAALEKWKIETPEIIKKGKALRNEFNKQPLEFIKAYNREELRLLVELMGELRIADEEAFETIGLHANHKSRIWYGPGSRAQNFLTQTNWVEEHPTFSGPVNDKLVEDVCRYFEDEELTITGHWDVDPDAEGYEIDDKAGERIAKEKSNLSMHPFAAAYFGGRIEAAAVGTFKTKLWDYDINSAYPYAISNLPHWNESDLVEVTGWDKLDRMGMYHIKWNLPAGVNFYPFPYRTAKKNVFFPRAGEGWVMSPEVDAALNIYTEGIEVINGYVLQGTEGAGSGVVRLPDEKLCTTAKKITEMAEARLIAKALKQSKEKSIKLILNSTYGKTIQHVGSHKFLNTFAAAWITSTCRAIISKTIGADVDKKVIAIMTDGILTREPLNVTIGKNLGEFESDEFISAIQLMPGIYLLEREDGTTVKRFRGMSKNFDAKKAVKILHKELKPYVKPHTEKEGYFPVTVTPFVTRTLAVRQPNVFGDKMYLFTEHTRMESFGLGAKRAPGDKGFRLKIKEQYKFFDPKEVGGFFAPAMSTPYYLGLEDLEKEYDESESIDELLDEDHVGSIFRDMALEIY